MSLTGRGLRIRFQHPRFLLGALLGLLLTGQLGLSLWVVLVMSLVGFLSITGLGLVSRVLTGEEHLLNNYRVQVLFLLLSGALLWALRRPVLPYLDLAATGAAVGGPRGNC